MPAVCACLPAGSAHSVLFVGASLLANRMAPRPPGNSFASEFVAGAFRTHRLTPKHPSLPCGPLSLQGEGWGEGTELAEHTELTGEPATLSLTLGCAPRPEGRGDCPCQRGMRASLLGLRILCFS